MIAAPTPACRAARCTRCDDLGDFHLVDDAVFQRPGNDLVDLALCRVSGQRTLIEAKVVERAVFGHRSEHAVVEGCDVVGQKAGTAHALQLADLLVGQRAMAWVFISWLSKRFDSRPRCTAAHSRPPGKACTAAIIALRRLSRIWRFMLSFSPCTYRTTVHQRSGECRGQHRHLSLRIGLSESRRRDGRWANALHRPSKPPLGVTFRSS